MNERVEERGRGRRGEEKERRRRRRRRREGALSLSTGAVVTLIHSAKSKQLTVY